MHVRRQQAEAAAAAAQAALPPPANVTIVQTVPAKAADQQKRDLRLSLYRQLVKPLLRARIRHVAWW
jgi:hypothetical protein